ncbi:hypothetical protein L5515_007057 [Caenorhabditis briggsae]|uniref:Uncharacterized protein n=1 Tax=Caenorhabditis briggsae TaxID=6238 RepID=A0AAE9JIX4_CAEBR|nr:hypothetical protein L5515_007057 [Caenorhabditis briggsae]
MEQSFFTVSSGKKLELRGPNDEWDTSNNKCSRVVTQTIIECSIPKKRSRATHAVRYIGETEIGRDAYKDGLE